NGRYFTMRPVYKPRKVREYGFPKLLFQLEVEYANGKKETFVSDASWKITSDGPVRANNEYDGEEYDATKEMPDWNVVGFNDKKWMKVQLVDAPGKKVSAQMTPNQKIMEVLKPVGIKKMDDNRYILDMGQNMVGWMSMKVRGQKGDTVVLRFAESLQDNGELFTANLRNAKVTDKYILKGDGEEYWEPSFVCHGFRFAEVKNYPGTPTLEDFEGKVIYDEMNVIGNVETSNKTINQIYKNAYWGIRGNYKGMPVDCPQRNERQPWLGDRGIGAVGESYIFNNATLYAKWLDDIEQSQTEEGAIPDVAPPYWNYYTDNMTWPAVYIIIADMLYTQFADFEPIRKHYPSMKKWMRYMRQKYMTEDYILNKDRHGDHCVPPESLDLIHTKDSLRKTAPAVLGTTYYYKMLQYMIRFAELQNFNQDVEEYKDLAEKVKDGFTRKFYNQETKQYDNNSTTANILVLQFGMVPDSLYETIKKNLIEKTKRENNSHVSSGVVGMQWVMKTHNLIGRSDLSYRMATNTTYPSWGYMIENGATTIWELWNGNTANPWMNSQNHVMMLGDLIVWLYQDLAGIRSDELAVGYKKIIMQPALQEDLNFVKASYHSPHGIIKSEWENGIQNFKWNVTIPANTSAIVHMPAYGEDEVREGGKSIGEVEGVKFLRVENKKVVMEVLSGSYEFSTTRKYKQGIVSEELIFTESSFPESHAATIAETGNGNLVAAWFGGTKERNPDVGIWVSLKSKGEEWSEPFEVTTGKVDDTTRYACWNPVLYQVPEGDLMLFYKVGSNVAGWKGYLKTSADGGKTWSEPKALPKDYLGPVKNKPVLLKNGTLICPSSTEGKSGWRVHFEMTKDFGKTWTKTDPINDGKTMNAIQPSVLVYPDGRLQVLCRSKNRAILQAWSGNNGKTWSKMTETNLPNNNSGTDAISLSDGKQLLAYNHVLPPDGEHKGDRTPLNVAVSKDGINWNAALVLDDGEGQYSYPSVIQTSDGMVHFIYTWKRERIKHVVVDPNKLELSPIVNGAWPNK
ncbi:MAG: family 78 glycoside hydrolase catalytic domain, partial [Prevotellaceae bacterium]|nr:family 78 glycoside hydrolase catalytic domain [Prevotellaceae bacterium]